MFVTYLKEMSRERDIMNCCRVCLDVGVNHISILQDPTINLQLKSCLTISVSYNDQLPKVICLSCVSQLSEFYNFLLNAKCSQDWLESSIAENSKRCNEVKMPVQPLPDSEYNSDSLLEFLNNTTNIEEYLNNLGKEDIPTIAGMLDRSNEHSFDNKKNKESPKKIDFDKAVTLNTGMEIDVLDSDIDIVKDLLLKETVLDKRLSATAVNKSLFICFACKVKFGSMGSLSQHLSMCDLAVRTCVHCNSMFDSKKQMLQHYITHTTFPLSCVCEKQFDVKDKLYKHARNCNMHIKTAKCVYKCKHCGIVYKDRMQLYKHVRGHLKKPAMKMCDICGQKFSEEQTLLKHREEVHNIMANYKFRCKICSFTSEDHSHVYLHVKRHLSQERHLCETCGCSFSTRTTLNRHSLIHTNKNYVCSVCCKKFDDVAIMELHMQEHDIVMCDKCGETVMLDKHNCI